MDAVSLQRPLELTRRMESLRYPYHQGILKGELPLSIGGGIGQSRTLMMLLRKAHLGEVKRLCVAEGALKEMCPALGIDVLE